MTHKLEFLPENVQDFGGNLPDVCNVLVHICPGQRRKRYTLDPMKEDLPGFDPSAGRSDGRSHKRSDAEASKPNKRPVWPPKLQQRDVEEIDTRRCLSMTRRVVRPPALPEVTPRPWGPFLN